MACAVKQILYSTRPTSYAQNSSPPPVPRALPSVATSVGDNFLLSRARLGGFYARRNLTTVLKSSPESDSIVTTDDDGEEGISLGTMKLPLNTDLQRFETLLFQWANSLCQGANLPLPMPLKVDKIGGGARLGFITIEDGKTEVLVYIDCLVFPATAASAPLFRAIRNGPSKDKSPPGEPRIMRSLLQALQKSIEIARI